MPADDPHDLPPDLARQLTRIEQIGNAEAELVAEEARLGVAVHERYASRRSVPRLSPREREAAHRLATLRERYRREAERTRFLGIILLALSPLLTVAYVVSQFYGHALLSAVCLLAAGGLAGFALVVLYYARRRQQKLE